ncbi:OsmC family protein [Halorussus litoreus]|uniref:OsmC family protein n=1 Tax=Halorussus litoreus TaxID=1710536 RepID=UPI000E236BB3|nr:OsmC family protein [Halorussus litoreus]
MSKQVTTVSEEGYASDNSVRDFDLTIDATGEEGPDTLEALLAAYGSCYVPALRVGAEQRDVGDLGRVEIDVNGDLNDDDKLAAVQFHVRTDAEMDDGQAEAVAERANELCKVHDALKAELAAEIEIDGHAV